MVELNTEQHRYTQEVHLIRRCYIVLLISRVYFPRFSFYLSDSTRLNPFVFADTSFSRRLC